MSEKALKVIIYVAGIVCLYAFLAIRIQPMFNLVVQEKIIPEYWENTKYGELYYFNFIKHFREKNLPEYHEKYRHSDRHPSMQEADILTFGDSFFDFTRFITFPEQLGNKMDKRVYYERYHDPLESLYKEKYTGDRDKVLIYESAERYIPIRFSRTHTINPRIDKRNSLRKKAAAVRDWLFLEDTEAKYTMLLNRSYPTTNVYSTISTLKFDKFGYITSLTPKYTLDYDIPWLFYHEQLNEEPSSFYYHHTDDEINYYCDNIKDLSEKLDSAYHLKMVFMPIPSKYTIYHNLINNDEYNNFLPRLYAGLEKRGVPVVKLYDDFNNADEIIYLGTDTHWNQKGIDIALKEVISELSSYYSDSYIANDSSIKKDNNQKNKL